MTASLKKMRSSDRFPEPFRAFLLIQNFEGNFDQRGWIIKYV
jgi:hypothetical protein